MHRKNERSRGFHRFGMFVVAALVYASAVAAAEDTRKVALIDEILSSGIGWLVNDAATAAFQFGLQSGCMSSDAVQPEIDVRASDELLRLHLNDMDASELQALATSLKEPESEEILNLMRVLLVLGSVQATGEAQEVLARARSVEEPEPVPRAMADIRTIATATEAFSIDNDGRYPDAKAIEELGSLISPIYVRNMPILDPWGKPYAYLMLDEGEGYRIASAGPDGRFDAFTLNPYVDIEPLAATGDDYDLVYENGSFLVYPAEIAARMSGGDGY